jgi:hypothetical protein
MPCTTAHNFFIDSRVVTNYIKVSLDIKHLNWDVIFMSPDENVSVVCSTVLGAFTKLQKATVRFILSICLFTWRNLAPTGQIFMKFDE